VNIKKWLGVAVLSFLAPFGLHGQATQQNQTTTNSTQATASTAKKKPASTQGKAPQAPSKSHYYTNSAGQRVQSPTQSSTAPARATAQRRDGSYSFSQSRRGTCSHHGGVGRWLTQ
jgi:Protein of unknown function (DUF3761)